MESLRRQLIGMLDSPYVRRVSVALIEAKVPFQHRPFSLFRHIDQFSRINPLLKAPTLVADQGTVLNDSSVILDYPASAYPAVAQLTPDRSSEPPRTFCAIGLALTVMEKAVQRHYERFLRPEEKRHGFWIERVMAQLHAGLNVLEAELPPAGWIAEALGIADITFIRLVIGDLVETARYPNVAEFSARAEALPAFGASPPEDAVAAPVELAGWAAAPG